MIGELGVEVINKKVKFAVLAAICLLAIFYGITKYYGKVFAIIKSLEVKLTESSGGKYSEAYTTMKNVDGFFEVDFDEAMGSASERHFKLYFKHGDAEYNLFKNLYNQNKPSVYSFKGNKIPKLIHQIWIGNNPIPTKYAFFQNSIRAQNSDWIYMLWDEKKIKAEKFADYDLYEKARTYPEKADIARYMILKKYGGVYIDIDTFCLRSFDPLLRYKLFTGIEPHNKSGHVHTGNGIIGAASGHRVISDTLKAIRSNWEKYEAQFEKGQLGGNRIENLVRSRTFFPFDLSFKNFSKTEPEELIALPAGYFYPSYYFKGYFDQIRVYSLASHDFSKSKSEVKMFNYADFWALYDEPQEEDKMKFETIKSIFKKYSPNKLPYKSHSPIPPVFHVFTENDEEVKNWQLHYPGSQVIKWSKMSDYNRFKFANLLAATEDPKETILLKKLIILYNLGGVVIDGLAPAINSSEFAQVFLELNDKYDFYGYLEQEDRQIRISEKLIGARVSSQLIEKVLWALKERHSAQVVFNDLSYKYIYLGNNMIFPKFYFE